MEEAKQYFKDADNSWADLDEPHRSPEKVMHHAEYRNYTMKQLDPETRLTV